MVPDPLVVQAMRQFKAGILSREVAQMERMARTWYAVEKKLAAQIDALAAEIAALGPNAGIGKITRLERYRQLLAQATDEFEKYSAYADGEITREQARLAQLGIDQSARAIQLSYYPAVSATFNRLPIKAVEYMVGNAGDGTPLGKVLRLRMVKDENGLPLPGVLEKLQTTLTNATAQGWNPVRTGRMMRDDFLGGLDKALEIARTEQLRVYRTASADQYRESGVVEYQIRVVTHDTRTCLGCLAAEGEIIPLGKILYDHPKGRCVPCPQVTDMPPIQFETAEDWIKRLPEERQKAVMGPQYYDLWKSGTPFGDFVTKTKNETWGESLGPTPLKNLEKAA